MEIGVVESIIQMSVYQAKEWEGAMEVGVVWSIIQMSDIKRRSGKGLWKSELSRV